MSYTQERDEFISRATAEGLSLDTCRKLLRYATTLQRLAEAQCNGDYPYNGDRDRPSRDRLPCAFCSGGNEPNCSQCQGTGWSYHESPAQAKHDKRYTVCPKCEASGVAKVAMRLPSTCEECKDQGEPRSHCKHRICPDCRTQELVNNMLANANLDANTERRFTCTQCGVRNCGHAFYSAIFQGDPRGAVLKLATPNYPWSDDGRLGNGLYVPARVTR